MLGPLGLTEEHTVATAAFVWLQGNWMDMTLMALNLRVMERLRSTTRIHQEETNSKPRS